MTKFSERLRHLRTERGFSQQEFANQLGGISKSSINMYERGEREPGLETLETIADFFNVDMDYLLGKSDIRNRIAFNVTNQHIYPWAAIGHRIRSCREERGLTLKDVAAKSGVSLSTISRYERGEFDLIKLPVVTAIANALHVDPDYILCKTNSPISEAAMALEAFLSPSINMIQIAGRDGTYIARYLTDDQLALFKSMLDQMKPIDDESV